jgi:acyl-CoA thioesterase I
MAIQISSETSLLFIGDSITDCGQRQDKEGIGSGYVRIIRDWLRAKDPAGAPTILNRGISGHRVTDLKERWERDVIASSPDVLSIKIGINDVWHGLGGRDNGVSIDDYRAVYRELLQQVRDSAPGCRLVLCEPSVIWPPQPEEGNTLLRPYVQAVHEMGEQFGAECIVPLHETFNRAKAARPDIDWAPDGVHPSSSGHMLIARAWLAATGLL